ncbi:efflux transporter outer membrane subunit [Rhodoferax sp.]|uniref:efflux transporter outer membrane subunit n=1 Tax=Rhodoferax sp. TaxID=50421 RepID=UPI0028418798|nr:efflux transporter outer membrane subunit [Rhodoferax sp.]MDR3371333.1 efflux transporter outer membrane subunit [Rhodoferax sp.]
MNKRFLNHHDRALSLPETSTRPRSVSRALTLLLPILLAACATQSPKPPAAFAAPMQFKESGIWKRADSLPGTVEVSESWWKLFHDPVLDNLQSQLLQGNQSLKSAAAQLQSAQAAVQASQQALWPTLSVGLTGTRSGGPGSSGGTTSNTVSLAANAAWEPDLWGRLAQASTVAGERAQASADDLAAARLSAQATLAQTYFSMRATEAQQTLLQRTLDADQKILDMTRARYASGVAAESDVLQAQTQLRSVQAQGDEATLQRALLEHAIAVLLGRVPSEFSIAPTGQLPEPPPVPTFLPSTLLARRPDIASAERNVAAAYAQIGVTDAAFFPDITLSASAGYRNSALGGLLAAPNALWSLGPSLVASVLDGGARRLASEQARASAEQAVASYRQTVLAALQEVEDNLMTVDQLGRELQSQQVALQAAKRNLEITQSQYQAGTVSFLNVASAQTAVLGSENGLLSVRNRQLAAINLLLKNAGGRWLVVSKNS